MDRPGCRPSWCAVVLVAVLVLVGVVSVTQAQYPTPAQTGEAAANQTTGARFPCVGDLDRDGVVTIRELLTLVRLDREDSTRPTVAPRFANVYAGIGNALTACPEPITYRLLEASTILVASGTPPAITEPLTGTFTVYRSQIPAPNTRFAFSIASVDLRSPQFSVGEGIPENSLCSAFEISIGCLNALTLDSFLNLEMLITVNTMPINVLGRQEFMDVHVPPSLSNMVICGGIAVDHAATCDDIQRGTGAGYMLSIFATPSS